MALATPAFAVIPAVIGPAQALLALLPQLLALLAAAALALLKPQTYRFLLRYLWVHKGMVLGTVLLLLAGRWTLEAFARHDLQQARPGPSWSAFEGGPSRLGCVGDSTGPLVTPAVAWNRSTFPGESSDSSPALVGNRMYFGSYLLKGIGKSEGMLVCRETETGNLVWSFDGRGLSRGSLNPIFSSPAVGNASEGNPAAESLPRFLVSGEGFHDDLGRIICLDLEPTYAARGDRQPRVHWVKQANSHVESSPCIFEGRAYIGAGDDGFWCVGLERGEVLWHLEGNKAYHVLPGPKAEELKACAGKTVIATGLIKRVGQTETKTGIVTLELRDFRVSPTPPPPPLNKGNGFERTVFGKVSLEAEALEIPAGEDRKDTVPVGGVMVEMSDLVLDAESSPIGGHVPIDPSHPEKGTRACVFFGSGVDGNKILCVDAGTGERVWQKELSFPAFGAPTLVDGRLYIGLGNGNMLNSDPNPRGMVICLSAADGQTLWQTWARDSIMGAVPVRDGFAYACSRDGCLYVLDAADGRLVKRIPAGSAMVCSPCVTRDAIYVSTALGKLVCLDRAGNSFRWSISLSPGNPILGSPVISQGRLFLGCPNKGTFCFSGDSEAKPLPAGPSLWSGPGGNPQRNGEADEEGLPIIDASGPAIVWETFPPDRYDYRGHLAAAGRSLFVALWEKGGPTREPFLACVEAASGSITWRRPLHGELFSLAADEALVYLLTAPGATGSELLALDTSSGKPRWSRALEGPGWRHLLLGSRAVAGSDSASRPDAGMPATPAERTQLIVGHQSGRLEALHPETGDLLWQTTLGGRLLDVPAVAHNLILATVASATDAQMGPPLLFLDCLDDSTGITLWRTTLPTVPIGPLVFADSRVVLAFPGDRAGEGMLRAYRTVNGRESWKYVVSGTPILHPAAWEDYVTFPTADGRLQGCWGSDGSRLFEKQVLISNSTQVPAMSEGVVIFAGENRLQAFDVAAQSEAWALDPRAGVGRILEQPVVLGGKVLAMTAGRGLIAVGPRRTRQEGPHE